MPVWRAAAAVTVPRTSPGITRPKSIWRGMPDLARTVPSVVHCQVSESNSHESPA
jgi:hypothetical protein